MELRIKELPVTEDGYLEKMKNVVEPYLDEHRTDGYFEGYDGNSLNYEYFTIPDAIGNIVIFHGFTESVVKFREMTYIYMLMGYNVFIYDQRGHGRSFRYPENPETVSIRKFDEYILDAEKFVDNVVKPAGNGLPLYIFAHSMGGAVAIQYLQKHQDVFRKAVLTAPMVMCKCAGVNPKLALILSTVMTAFGQGDKACVGFHGFNPDRNYMDSNNTSEIRFRYIHGNKCADRRIQTSDASYQWLREAVRISKKNLDAKRCAKITTPILLCQPEVDGSVVSEKEDEFIALVPDGRLEKFTKCRHEIFGSVDETMLEYLKTIEKFLKG